MKKTVFIFGESGRMGQEVIKAVEKSPVLQLVGGFSSKKPPTKLETSPDIVIDFSLPASLPVLYDFIKTHKSCLVSGTTGFTDSQFLDLQKLGSSTPVFWAANMSFGIYLMSELTKTLARYQHFYDYHVEEVHHIHKKDKPSGTAIIIENAAKKSTSQLGPTISHREGEVFGIHRFIASSVNERLEICHEAHNRGLFAQGAVDISLWLSEKPPGFYQMEDFFKTFDS